MKTSTNQAVKDVNKAFAELIRAISYIAFVIPASKLKLIFDYFGNFSKSSSVDLKKCLYIISIILLIAVHFFTFSKLIGRALDIEADAQEMVMIEYKESLKDMDEGE